MISHKNKYIFTHVPRTAGTSIEYALRENSDPVPMCNKDPEDLSTYLYTQHVNINKIFRFSKELNVDIEDYYKFTFVRNPWERLLSYYYYNHLSNEVPVKGEPELSFVDYCMRGADSPALSAKRVAVVENLYCRPPGYKTQEILVDYVGRYETLQQDFDHVCTRLGLSKINLTRQRSTGDQSTCPWHVERGVPVISRTTPVKDHYTPELVEYLQPYFAVEINKLGYPSEPT